ncbi:hypothetical protein HOLleu_31420 [Holothuria leucospilota]|uniref:Uncharacterized protein n=1 Tax=Holothuria leucospilota TaxID=206669 RepID=A0A9Q1BG94_HOLLE|nr:hypothetical protein HOLleu_31420 [Holothuria leucospilota]
MAKFEYDESGGTSLYFVVSFYVLFLIPFTYILWPSKERKLMEHAKVTCTSSAQHIQESTQAMKERLYVITACTVTAVSYRT